MVRNENNIHLTIKLRNVKKVQSIIKISTGIEGNMLTGSTVNICFVKWRNRPTIKKNGFENRSDIVVIFSAKQKNYEINLEQSLIPLPFFLMWMIINKPFSDKTTFFLLTSNNDPNLYQFYLPFLSLMPYPLKWCLQCTISIKKGYQRYCWHGHGRKLLQTLHGKSTKLSNSSFKIWSLFMSSKSSF